MRNILIHKNYQNDYTKEEINKLKNNKNIKEMDSLILDVLNKLSEKELKRFIENYCSCINFLDIINNYDINNVVSDIQAKLKEKNIDLNKKKENKQPVTETTEENTKPEEKKGLFMNILDSIYSVIKAIAQAIIDFIKFFIPNSILESSTVSTKNTEKSK